MRKLLLELQTQMVLFFKDPLASHAHEVDINMLLRVCDVHNVPIANEQQQFIIKCYNKTAIIDISTFFGKHAT
jgi:methylglyoxal synthase